MLEGGTYGCRRETGAFGIFHAYDLELGLELYLFSVPSNSARLYLDFRHDCNARGLYLFHMAMEQNRCLACYTFDVLEHIRGVFKLYDLGFELRARVLGIRTCG